VRARPRVGQSSDGGRLRRRQGSVTGSDAALLPPRDSTCSNATAMKASHAWKSASIPPRPIRSCRTSDFDPAAR
jgi:hypothetical protein